VIDANAVFMLLHMVIVQFFQGTKKKIVGAMMSEIKTFEYRGARGLKEINKLGADGWHVVQVVRLDYTSEQYCALMEREVRDK
jgi:hypothetical protein